MASRLEHRLNAVLDLIALRNSDPYNRKYLKKEAHYRQQHHETLKEALAAGLISEELFIVLQRKVLKLKTKKAIANKYGFKNLDTGDTEKWQSL